MESWRIVTIAVHVEAGAHKMCPHLGILLPESRNLCPVHAVSPSRIRERGLALKTREQPDQKTCFWLSSEDRTDRVRFISYIERSAVSSRASMSVPSSG